MTPKTEAYTVPREQAKNNLFSVPSFTECRKIDLFFLGMGERESISFKICKVMKKVHLPFWLLFFLPASPSLNTLCFNKLNPALCQTGGWASWHPAFTSYSSLRNVPRQLRRCSKAHVQSPGSQTGTAGKQS